MEKESLLKRHFTQSNHRERGSILVIVVFVLMLVSFWVFGFTKETLFSQRDLATQIDRKKAYQAAKAGLEYSLFLLESQGIETLDGSHQFEDARFQYQVRNEDGKWDFNSLVDGDGHLVDSQAAGISRFLALAGFKAEAPQIVQSFADWVDADDIARTHGAESRSYEGVRCANSPMQAFSEWKWVQGINDLAKAKILRRGCTLFSTGKININTAPFEVVMTLSEEMNEPLAKEILSFRRGRKIQQISDLKQVQGMTDSIFADIENQLIENGFYYSILVQGESRDAIVKIGAVAKREEDRLKIVWFKKDLEDEDLLAWN